MCICVYLPINSKLLKGWRLYFIYFSVPSRMVSLFSFISFSIDSILWWRLSELHTVHKLTVLGQQSPASSPPPLLPGIDDNPCELCWDRGALRRGDVMSILSIAVPDLYERDQGEQSHSCRADIRDNSRSFSINPHIY